MAKELNKWLDEFVENGADASDVINWPENAGGGGNSVVISGYCDYRNKGSMKAFIDGDEIELQELQSENERECLYSMNVPLNKEIEIWYISNGSLGGFHDFYFNGEMLNIENIEENNTIKFNFTFTYGGYLSLEVLGAD